MWTRRRILLLFLAVSGLTLASLYEAATHVGRGWLRGDALYQGRPTSYWRSRCDEWLERFDTVEDAAHWIPPGISVPIVDDRGFTDMSLLRIRPRTQTFWTQVTDRFRSADDRWQEDWPPRVLFGYPGSEPVLEALAQEPKYRSIVERPLKYAKVYRKWGHDQ
jgi:hypothetical protein